VLFALTLLGIALFHRYTLPIALVGLGTITAYKLAFTGFKDGAGLVGFGLHLSHEFSLLANLFLLLMGFALLARHFEESAIPDEMPALLAEGWKGGLMLLMIVFVLSSFLDNIAGAIIGGTIARHVFGGKVHMGYLAAIVAASNAGGAGSVMGDTTTTMTNRSCECSKACWHYSGKPPITWHHLAAAVGQATGEYTALRW